MKKISNLVVIATAAVLMFGGCKDDTDGTIAVTSVSIDLASPLTLTVGDERAVIVTIIPVTATVFTVEWESTDATVAKVEDGKIKALKEGSAALTVKSTADATKKATIEVTVEAETAAPRFVADLDGNASYNVEQFSGYTALSAVTYETWFKLHEWVNPTLAETSWGLMTLIGVAEAGSLGIDMQTQTNSGWDYYMERGRLRVCGIGGDNWGTFNGISLNRWYHIAVVYDGSEVTLYVNGVKDISYAATGTVNIAKYAGGAPFSIGEFEDGQRKIKGEISEVRVWSVARTSQELIANQCGVDPAAPGLIAYWKFNDNGGIVKDYSLNGYDITENAPAKWRELSVSCVSEE